MPGSGFTWDDHELDTNLSTLNARTEAALGVIAHAAAAEAEAYMKENAPWQDGTGQARAQLAAEAQVDGSQYTLVLAHGVTYGIFLETQRSGENEIIRPAVDHAGAELMTAAAQVWSHVLRGQGAT